MPHDSRASGNCPEHTFEELERSGVACALQAQVRSGGITILKRIAADQHRHLVELVSLVRMFRRSDGYGTQDKTLMPFAIATVLKARRLAVAGFSHDMVATERGKLLAKQQGGSDAAD